MIRTILVLIAALVAVPIFAFYHDQPLNAEIWSALRSCLGITFGIGLACFVVAELTGNCSQTDKLWNILPAFYGWFFCLKSGFDPRLMLMAGLATVWSVRISYNFWRRGGYSWIPWQGEEDYRWAVLRREPHLQGRWRWAAFNLFFISMYQHGLILLFTLPLVVAWQGAARPLDWPDWLAAGLMLLFIFLETLADQQQWNFHAEKNARQKTGQSLDERLARGFCTDGLWRRSRHPNYACEQLIWLCFYGFSVAATGRWVNWSLAGAILLMLLFLGSSDFSEKISASKYPGYADYQKRVPRFWPRFF